MKNEKNQNKIMNTVMIIVAVIFLASMIVNACCNSRRMTYQFHVRYQDDTVHLIMADSVQQGKDFLLVFVGHNTYMLDNAKVIQYD